MEWLSGDVDTNGIRMHYYRTGGDKPPIVLSHGATDSGLCWTRVARALESDYDLIMPDARGHGLSDAPLTGYSSTDHAADLAGLIGALGLERPAVCGHSMGGGTTLRLVADYPELASRAILEDPPIRSGAPQGEPLAPGRENPRDIIRRVVLDAQATDLQTTIARGRAASPGWADEEFGPWADAKQHVSLHFLDSGVRWAQDWRELLSRVMCSTLLVTSDPERGAIVTPEMAQEARRLLPGLQVVRLSGAGHNIRREQFEGFVDAVRGFLST